jgi:hypothetical protein
MSDADIFDARIQSDREAAMSQIPMTEGRVAALYVTHREEIHRFLEGQGLEPAKAQELARDVFVKLAICAVLFPSDVAAGEIVATAVVEQLHT